VLPRTAESGGGRKACALRSDDTGAVSSERIRSIRPARWGTTKLTWNGRTESLEAKKTTVTTAVTGGWAPLPFVRRAATGLRCARPDPYRDGQEPHRRFPRAGTPRQRQRQACRSRQ